MGVPIQKNVKLYEKELQELQLRTEDWILHWS